MNAMPQTVGIVGVGLIGGSIGLGLLQQGVRVIGYEPNTKGRDAAKNCVSVFAQSLEELVAQTDIILLAAPIDALPSVLTGLQKCRSIERKLISDISSVKQDIIAMVNDVFGEILPRFVPGHPIAGSEKHTAAFSDKDLFVGKKTLLTPVEQTEQSAVDQITVLWNSLGAEVQTLTPLEHDVILSMTSHLPHMLAYTLMHYIASQDQGKELPQYSAGGLQSFTRIAYSKPSIWSHICISNRENILRALHGFQNDLQVLTDAIQADDVDSLEDFFSSSKKYKDIE